MSSRPINDLSILVDEVFVPILSSPVNHKGWPGVVVQDVKAQLQTLRNSIAEVRGNIDNRTILPLPITINQVMSESGRILGGDLEACTIHLRKSLEEIVMKWSITIEEVIKDNSFRLFEDIRHPQPSDEIDFWKGRLKNLENIFEQLRDVRVKTIASILEKCESTYFSAFRLTFQNVVTSLHEARDVTLHLIPLDNQVERFFSCDWDDVRPILKSIMLTICLIWSNSKYYNSNDRMVHLFRLVHNMFIDKVKLIFDPTTAFQSDPVEALNQVNAIIDSLNYYK